VYIIKFLIMYLLNSPVSLSGLGLNIQSTLYSNILSQHTSLNVSNQVLNPYKTAGKIKVIVYVSLYIFG